MSRLGQEHELTRRFGEQGARTYGEANQQGMALIERLTEQLSIHPRKFCLGLASAIDAGGGHVFEQTRALNLRPGFPCTVKTEHGELRAQQVVLATQFRSSTRLPSSPRPLPPAPMRPR